MQVFTPSCHGKMSAAGDQMRFTHQADKPKTVDMGDLRGSVQITVDGYRWQALRYWNANPRVR